MKKHLATLHLSKEEIADLLRVPRSTLSTWLLNNRMLPVTYRPYEQALQDYIQHTNEDILDDVETTFEYPVLLDNQKTLQEQLEKLTQQLEEKQLAFKKLQMKQRVQIKRWHLAKQLATYFPPDFSHLNYVQEWCHLLEGKSRYQLQNKLAVVHRKLLIDIAGLEAQITTIEVLLKEH